MTTPLIIEPVELALRVVLAWMKGMALDSEHVPKLFASWGLLTTVLTSSSEELTRLRKPEMNHT